MDVIIMEYFLAFDKGTANCDIHRYKIIPNNYIHISLAKNNNLKALCSFTSRFYDEQDLKDTIIRLNPCFLSYKDCNLVILWRRKNGIEDVFNSNSVPYKDNAHFFNFENLVAFITNNVYTSFFNDLLDFYQGYAFLKSEMNALNNAVQEGKKYSIIEQAIRNFLRRLLYKGDEIDFSSLYKIAMFISQHTHMNEQDLGLFSDEGFLDDDVSFEYPEGRQLLETEEFEREWLNRRARLRQLGLW